ncbi:hypothetical protein PUN28_003847 [Cardiocondyla obscurior]|uniref:Uncharacterized protein n=1 Tax=Cardiocondyla obscurior TaxID=286306 RepID=A0AAW2GP52_9HYME
MCAVSRGGEKAGRRCIGLSYVWECSRLITHPGGSFKYLRKYPCAPAWPDTRSATVNICATYVFMHPCIHVRTHTPRRERRAARRGTIRPREYSQINPHNGTAWYGVDRTGPRLLKSVRL